MPEFGKTKQIQLSIDSKQIETDSIHSKQIETDSEVILGIGNKSYYSFTRVWRNKTDSALDCYSTEV